MRGRHNIQSPVVTAEIMSLGFVLIDSYLKLSKQRCFSLLSLGNMTDIPKKLDLPSSDIPHASIAAVTPDTNVT